MRSPAEWIKRGSRAALRRAGVEVRRTPAASDGAWPSLLDDPLAAVHLARERVPVGFRCRLDLARDTQGFSFAPAGWHPLVETIHERDFSAVARYEGSVLQRYYAAFRPRTALEAIPGFEARGPCGLDDLPPHLFWLTPWLGVSVEELDLHIRAWVSGDVREHGLADFDLDRHGVPYHGPASAALGHIETRRLASLHRSIGDQGYDRRQGDSRFYLVCRDGGYRAVLLGGGLHRTAAAASLGYESVPAQFQRPIAVDVRDVDHWPQVRSGVWSRTDALGYVDHLFDFDSAAWASRRHLAAAPA